MTDTRIKTGTFRVGRDSFKFRESRFEPGTFKVFYLLTGRGRGQMVWIADSPSNQMPDLLEAVRRGRRNGEF